MEQEHTQIPQLHLLGNLRDLLFIPHIDQDAERG